MSRIRLVRLAALLSFASGLAASAAHAQSVETRLADLRLATAVRLALVRDAETRALDVEVAAESGTVRLSPSSADALRVARGVAGVRSIDGPASAGARVDRSEAPVPTSEVAATDEAPRAASWGAAPRAETPAPSVPSGPAVHVVGRGETLFSLARRYGTTVDALRRLNGLSGTAGIEIGQRLRLR
ncbi:MAG TPA: LysM peptidoglycan-binding domain-containing protein [Rubricoccaceae bacterium]|jgi:LysM repeat protein